MQRAPVKRTILVVAEDSPARSTILRYLILWGYQTATAESPADALKQLAHPTDLIFLELMVSGVDGLTILRELTETNDKIRILLLVDERDVSKAQAALSHGARDYITKPIQQPALKRILQVHLTH